MLINLVKTLLYQDDFLAQVLINSFEREIDLYKILFLSNIFQNEENKIYIHQYTKKIKQQTSVV